MKWILGNAIGALAWLAGLFYVRGAPLPDGNIFANGNHQFVVAATCGLIGLVALVWTNLSSAA